MENAILSAPLNCMYLDRILRAPSPLPHLERLELMLEVLRVLWCRESPSCTTFLPEMLNWRSRYTRSPLQSTHQPLTQLDIYIPVFQFGK